MESEYLLDYFEAEVAELLDLAATQQVLLGNVAPACDPLTAADLVAHLGEIYTGVRSWVLDGRRPLDWSAARPDGTTTDWTAAAAHALIDVFLPRKAAAPCATWSAADRSNGFWFRRMAHETAVHRVDVAQAVDRPWTLDEDLAVDGIEEAIILWLGTRLGVDVGGSGRTVRLVTPVRDWQIRPTDKLIDFPVGGPADASVEGEVAAVWAWVWGRTDAAHPVQITGDESAAAELRGLFARTMHE